MSKAVVEDPGFAQVDPGVEEDFLTADDIYNSDDTTVMTVVIPEWKKNGKPGTLGLRVMMADEAIQYNEVLKNPQTRRGSWVRLLALCACNKAGERIFTEADLEKLRKKNNAVFLRLQSKLMQINGMIRAEKTWEALEEILNDCKVEPAVIELVKSKWDTPEEAIKKA